MKKRKIEKYENKIKISRNSIFAKNLTLVAKKENSVSFID